MRLNSMQIDGTSWWIKNEIDLLCPVCHGEGIPPCKRCDGTGDTDDAPCCECYGSGRGDEPCAECDETGSYAPVWNTIWDTGFSARASTDTLPRAIGPVLAFEYDGNIWLGLLGCGADLSPHLCAAWMTLFPDCMWLPANFVSLSNLLGDYYADTLGAECGRKVLDLYVAQLHSTIESCQTDLACIERRLAADAT